MASTPVNARLCSNRSLRIYAASVELPTLWARAASATAHGVDVCSITQSRKLERNP